MRQIGPKGGIEEVFIRQDLHHTKIISCHYGSLSLPVDGSKDHKISVQRLGKDNFSNGGIRGVELRLAWKLTIKNQKGKISHSRLVLRLSGITQILFNKTGNTYNNLTHFNSTFSASGSIT